MGWKFKVLVVANVTGSSPELLDALKRRAAKDSCAFTLVIPATGGGTGGREAAKGRLADALERMRADGLEAEGHVGDADPVASVSDIWDPGEFDEVVVSTLPTGSSRWLAIDLPHRVEKLSGVPVRHVVAQPPRPPAKVEHVEEAERYGLLSPFAAVFGRGRPSAGA